MDNEFKLYFLAVSENEALARIAATAFVTPLNPTLSQLTELKTAVSEAVTNAIIHGYPGDEKGQVLLSMYRDKSLITLEVKDWGCGIEDVEQAKEPLFTSQPEMERSGMGFTIMESFMDELTVESTKGSGTRVTMRKHITPE